MSLKVPCLNCPDRTITCHSVCKAYINFKKENEKLREEKHKNKQVEQDYYGFKEQQIIKSYKRR